MTEYSSNFRDRSGKAAVSKFKEMIRKQESYFFDVEDIEDIVEYYAERGNFTMAERVVSHGLQLYPNSFAVLLKSANIQLMARQAEKALKTLNFLEKAEPGNTDVLLLKAIVCRSLKDHEGTKQCLIKAINNSTENREELFLDLAFEQEMVNDYAGAIESLMQSLKYNPQHEASLFELGYCFDMADDLEKGVDFFNNYIDRFPYSFVAWYNLASCYEKLGLFEKAIEATDYCIAIKDDFVNAHILKGNCLVNNEEDRKAIEAFEEALLLDTINISVLYYIGECYERLDEFELAIDFYEQALILDPDHVESIMGLGAVRELQGNMPEAINLYYKALQIESSNSEYWHIYAEALHTNERYEDAIGTYEYIIAEFQEDEDAWVNLAESQAIFISLEKAIETLEGAMHLFPENSEIMFKLTQFLLQNGRQAQAEFYLSSALQIDFDGHKTLLSHFPEAALMENIARLIELYKH